MRSAVCFYYITYSIYMSIHKKWLSFVIISSLVNKMYMDIIFFIGRVLFGGFFLYNAYQHLWNHSSMAGYAASKGVPFAQLAVIGSGLLILLGGYTMIAGVRVALGVWCIVLFLVPVTFQMQAFWKEGPEM